MSALHACFSGADGKLFSVPLRQVSHPEQVQAADFTGPVLSAVSSFLLPACLIELPVHPGGITQAGHGLHRPGFRQSNAQLSSAHGRLRVYRQSESARQTPDELPVRLPVLDDRETYWLSVQLFRAEYGHSGLRSRLPDDLPAGHGHLLKGPLFFFQVQENAPAAQLQTEQAVSILLPGLRFLDDSTIQRPLHSVHMDLYRTVLRQPWKAGGSAL